ncbi:50S ribosomal protein L24, partial [Tepidiforma sp.]|uniref:50S ribosomal protein L24 n=1 Tax=Tepidiforma sp. TaxID=2682230 RepID=UPI00262A9127
GDTVEVISGKHRGMRGTVRRVLPGRSVRFPGQLDPNRDRVIVAGVNMVIKHQRRTGNVRTQTGRIEREAPIHISNVMLVCPTCSKATRVGYQIAADGSKSRVCKKCGALID